MHALVDLINYSNILLKLIILILFLMYSDFAKGNGYTYEKLGFKKLELTKPNYVWKNKNEILSRYQTQMKDEIKIMKSKGYDRIFDCGSYKWLWKNNI